MADSRFTPCCITLSRFTPAASALSLRRVTPLKALAAALVACAALASQPALAGKKDDTLRMAYDQAPESVDPYFNNVRIGVIIGANVWDTLVYRDRRRRNTRASSRRAGSRSTTARSRDRKSVV